LLILNLILRFLQGVLRELYTHDEHFAAVTATTLAGTSLGKD
jgi:hypothetical protein